MSAIELLPCPFCGCRAEIERQGNRRQSTIYQCLGCSCSLETGEEFSHGKEWNRRTDLTPPASDYVAGQGLKRIVEEIDGAMKHGTWRDEHGMRLKDTPEWVAFYNALATPPMPTTDAQGSFARETLNDVRQVLAARPASPDTRVVKERDLVRWLRKANIHGLHNLSAEIRAIIIGGQDHG